MKSTNVFLHKNSSSCTFHSCVVNCMQIKPKSKNRLSMFLCIYENS